MLKKILVFALALMLVLSACSANEPEVTEIPENATWDRNLTEHWINGEEGSKVVRMILGAYESNAQKIDL